MSESKREPSNMKVGDPMIGRLHPIDRVEGFKSAKTRQAEALERIADTLDRMLAVMLADEPEEADPQGTLDYADESTPWTEDNEDRSIL